MKVFRVGVINISWHYLQDRFIPERASDYPDNPATEHLFSGGRRPDTAFQRYRNSRLGGEFHSEITGRTLSECLDECLRQISFQCRSAVYSERYRTCRLSRYNQKDGMRIIYDADYDYYENLMRELDDFMEFNKESILIYFVSYQWEQREKMGTGPALDQEVS